MPDSSNITDYISEQRLHFGSRPDPMATGRLAEAQRLTNLFHKGKMFSFGRLGDYDVGFLINPVQAASIYNKASEKISGTAAFASPGLSHNQAFRLRNSLERISYLDFYDRQWKDSSVLDRAQIKRMPGGFRNPNRETSFILPTWLEFEFRDFCRGKRILFCGAEAPLLENLIKTNAFRNTPAETLFSESAVWFLRPRENGKNLSANLDLIKTDIIQLIRENEIDVLFLSLGGGAKILCSEIAEELQIIAIDFGVGLRSLTYSGSDGNLSARSTHLVFYHRVPFERYMDCLIQSYPDLTKENILAKAHAQLLLEVQEKEVGWSHSAWEYDFSDENREYFYKGFKSYQKRFQDLFNYSLNTKNDRLGFLHFCGTHKLTNEGKLFLKWFNFKNMIKSMIKS